MKVLYIADMTTFPSGTCVHRYRALLRLGLEVEVVDSCLKKTLFNRVLRKLKGIGPDRSLEKDILRRAGEVRYDLLWLDKVNNISAGTLKRIREMRPEMTILGYSPDDMMNPRNQSRCLMESLEYYDCYLTTKSYNVGELEDAGCPKAYFIENAFEPDFHRPMEISAEEKAALGGSVGFIGTAERQRAMSMDRLAREFGEVKVWGKLWDQWKEKLSAAFTVAGPYCDGEMYVKIVCSFDINLCFLRKENRDLQTTRSIEIPACGQFMLAERTHEHLCLFEEGKEAEFFESDEEMVEKARYYIQNSALRMKIAEAGRQRCIEGGYSNDERIRKALIDLNLIG